MILSPKITTKPSLLAHNCEQIHWGELIHCEQTQCRELINCEQAQCRELLYCEQTQCGELINWEQTHCEELINCEQTHCGELINWEQTHCGELINGEQAQCGEVTNCGRFDAKKFSWTKADHFKNSGQHQQPMWRIWEHGKPEKNNDLTVTRKNKKIFLRCSLMDIDNCYSEGGLKTNAQSSVSEEGNIVMISASNQHALLYYNFPTFLDSVI